MKAEKALILGLSLLAAPCLALEAPFYYSGGVRIPLLIDSSKVTLQFQANITAGCPIRLRWG